MIFENLITKVLGETFLLHFDVISCGSDVDPVYEIRPRDSELELFYLRLSIRNRIRVIVEFFPEKYSANLVHEMGEASDTKKKLFENIAKSIVKAGISLTVSINETEIDFLNLQQYGTQWNQLHMKVTKLAGSDQYFSILSHPEDIIDIVQDFMGLILALVEVQYIEDNSFESEGDQYSLISTRYERSKKNRLYCLKVHGTKCKICGFDFEAVYGEAGKGFIHVHHRTPVSEMGDNYIVDPVNDLIPLCPNCHCMIHSTRPEYTVEEIEAMFNRTLISED